MQKLVIWISLYTDHLFGKHNNASEVVTDNNKPKKHELIIKYVFPISCGLIVALAIIGIVSVKYPLVQVSVLDHNFSSSSGPEYLKRELEQATSNYTIRIKPSEKGSTTAYTLDQAGLSPDWQATFELADKYKNPQTPLKRLAFWDKKQIDLQYKVNDETFNNFVASKLTRIINPPVNASVTIDKGVVSITNDTSGEMLTIPNAKETLLKRAGSLNGAIIVLSKTTANAAITKKESEEAKTKIESLLNKSVSFSIAGKKIAATPADIGAWIDIHEVEQAKTFDYAVNSGRILDYLNNISKPYVSPPKNAVVLPNNNSRVLIAGRNGMDIVDKENVAAEVAKKLVSANSIDQPLTVSYQKYKTIQAVPYDKWIAVDLVNKRMYAYEKTELINTFLVSAGAPATPTVVGSYKIYRKIPSQTMSGPNADGSRYVQPNVQWVNYFYKDYAIHGNYWRPVSYFGNINSSHGCVGIVNTDASWIYDWAPVGTTVITF